MSTQIFQMLVRKTLRIQITLKFDTKPEKYARCKAIVNEVKLMYLVGIYIKTNKCVWGNRKGLFHFSWKQVVTGYLE